MNEHYIQRGRERTFVGWVTSKVAWWRVVDVELRLLVCGFDRRWWVFCCFVGVAQHGAMVRRVSSGCMFRRYRASVNKAGLVWCMLHMYCFPSWTANHSVYFLKARSDIGILQLCVTYTCNTGSCLHFYVWAWCVHVLPSYGVLGGYVEPSTRVHFLLQHHKSVLPACSVKGVFLSVLGSILPPYSNNISLTWNNTKTILP